MYLLAPWLLMLTFTVMCSAPVWSEQESLRELVARSRKVALQVEAETTNQLLKEMELSGPLRSLLVCKYTCPGITSAWARRTGWKVTLVSLKPRNAAGLPDAWEQKVLIDFARRAAKDKKADRLEYAEIVAEPSGRYFRYAKAVLVVPMCLSCHGAKETLPEPVRDQLSIDYPFDQATGFQSGDIYGIVSIKHAY